MHWHRWVPRLSIRKSFLFVNLNTFLKEGIVIYTSELNIRKNKLKAEILALKKYRVHASEIAYRKVVGVNRDLAERFFQDFDSEKTFASRLEQSFESMVMIAWDFWNARVHTCLYTCLYTCKRCTPLITLWRSIGENISYISRKETFINWRMGLKFFASKKTKQVHISTQQNLREVCKMYSIFYITGCN